MAIGILAKLGAPRLASLGLMLAQNVLIARFLSLEQIGQYYLITTIAYVGNATVFVGADLYLQRQLSDLSVTPNLSRLGLWRYIAVTAPAGGCVVLLASAIYFAHYREGGWVVPATLCAILSMATYLGAIGRNLLQLANRPGYSNLGPLTESITRSGLITALAMLGHANAITVASTSALGSLLAFMVTVILLFRISRDQKESYLGSLRSMWMKILPIGGSGLLNWAQLQGYRPIVADSSAGTQVVGTIAFMSTLGGTAANAVFIMLGQIQVPKQYQSRGLTTPRYLVALLIITIMLAILSLPCGIMFLWLTHRMGLIHLCYLVALGVIIEAGNAAIGVCTNHLNVLGKSQWHLPLAGVIGSAITYGILLFPSEWHNQHLQIAISLLAGQLHTVAIVMCVTYIKSQSLKHA